MIFRRRLHLQIYLTILASLFLVVVVAALSWHLFGQRSLPDHFMDRATTIATLVLPSADAPETEQVRALERLGKAMGTDISLYGPNGDLIAAHGAVLPLAKLKPGAPSWPKSMRDGRLTLPLDDGRAVVVDLRKDRQPLFGLLIILGSVALGIGIASYPFVRRLTGRLERLQEGVEQVGGGDLSTRVKVEGRDEVAALAGSFNRTAERIQSLVDSQRLLLANASHELRTPLARIRMGIEMLVRDNDSKHGEALKADIAELDILIDELLTLTRLESDKGVGHAEAVDLLALAAEECARYEACQLEGQPCTIEGDRHLLQRLIRNLLDNSRIHGTAPAILNVGPNASGTIELWVEDAGAGLPESLVEQVFEPFVRGKGAQNRPGSGLGLPLVRHIAEAHRGAAEAVRFADGKYWIRVLLPGEDGHDISRGSAV